MLGFEAVGVEVNFFAEILKIGATTRKHPHGKKDFVDVAMA